MAKDDYTNYAPGALRLKGAKIDKTKKKKKKPKPANDDAAVTTPAKTGADSADIDNAVDADFVEDERGYEPQKTDAQKKHEALQLRREMERLERGGHIKSHKERVEEFNKKLAAQSEHHDMPKIGPG